MRSSSKKWPSLAALIVVVASVGSEAQGSRIASIPANPSLSGLSGYTPADLEILRQEQASFVDSRIVPSGRFMAVGNGTFQVATPAPQTASPWMQSPFSLPLTLEQATGGSVGPSDLASFGTGSPLASNNTPLKPPVAWHVLPSSSLKTPRPPGLDPQFLLPTPAPEPSTIVLAVGLIVGAAWRSRLTFASRATG